MLFDWLITGPVSAQSLNPTAAVLGPQAPGEGQAPSARCRLTAPIPTATVRQVSYRARIATLTYSFVRVGAVLKTKILARARPTA